MRAFSLVELSIVLVILGLLTGGILAGQSLIRASELRAVVSEYQRYVTAGQTFRDKYFAIPGDMPNATRFWGDDNTNCPDAAIANGTPGTCNGNGDGVLALASAADTTGEAFQLWKQLALAGLIEGTYSGLAGPGGHRDFVLGTNSPRSKFTNAGWGSWSFGLGIYGDGCTFNASYGNFLGFGGQRLNGWPFTGALTPEEAWNIDTKLDDGKPASGKVLPRDFVCFGIANGCTNGASQTDFAAAYNLSVTNAVCALHFAQAF